jgi:hypothetical protein
VMYRAAIWILLVSLPATHAFAQRSGGARGGGARGPSLAPVAHPGGVRATPSPRYMLYPPLWGGYDYGYGYDSEPAAPEPARFPAPVIFVPPPLPVRSDIREYKPAAAEATSSDVPMFAIALKNGTSQSATAVWAEGQELHYFDPDGRHLRVALDAVDREATRRLNAQRKLQLRLPPAR